MPPSPADLGVPIVWGQKGTSTGRLRSVLDSLWSAPLPVCTGLALWVLSVALRGWKNQVWNVNVVAPLLPACCSPAVTVCLY